jgi:SRSO17 transposase
MAGKSIKDNEGPNLDRYYDGYKASMEKANKAGNIAYANEINRAHGLNPNKKSPPAKKQTGPKPGSWEWRQLHGLTT